jgi:hypothetical protein
MGMSLRSVQRIWQAHDLQPHRIRTFKRSRDPSFAAKLTEIIRLYVDPPAHAVVLSLDEKSQIQALDRTQPGLPIKPGRCQTMTHDYKRHGTTTLFAALSVLDGTVIARYMQRHRHSEFTVSSTLVAALRELRVAERTDFHELNFSSAAACSFRTHLAATLKRTSPLSRAHMPLRWLFCCPGIAMEFAAVHQTTGDVGGLQQCTLSREMGGQIPVNGDNDVSALVAVAPFAKLSHARLEHLIGVKTGIFAQQRLRQRRNQGVGRVTQQEMPCDQARRRSDLVLAVESP